ncbi:MAG: hypothetical protein ABIM89_11235 [Mycobacteriales bacterium]
MRLPVLLGEVGENQHHVERPAIRVPHKCHEQLEMYATAVGPLATSLGDRDVDAASNEALDVIDVRITFEQRAQLPAFERRPRGAHQCRECNIGAVDEPVDRNNGHRKR